MTDPKQIQIQAPHSICWLMMAEQEQRELTSLKDSRKAFRDKHGDKSPMDVLAVEGITIGGNSKGISK